MVEVLTSKHKALGLIPITEKKKKVNYCVRFRFGKPSYFQGSSALISFSQL